MSDEAEEPHRRYRVAAPYVQFRVPNVRGLRANGVRASKWLIQGAQQGSILPDDVHPDDLTVLLAKKVPGTKDGPPMLELLPSS